jgi:3,4-dihydroxy-2-butanone 4-phosphate synthase
MTDPQKAQSPGGAGQSADQSKQAPIIGEPTETSKRSAMLLAQFALAGHVVHRLADGGFLVCRHGHIKHCPDLAALAGFARQTGVAK